MVYIKIHKGSHEIVAICDEDLIGKKFHKGKLVLNITEYFYKGEKKSDNDTNKVMKEANNLNIVGKKSIKIALELGIIDKESVIVIGGVPHVQAITL